MKATLWFYFNLISCRLIFKESPYFCRNLASRPISSLADLRARGRVVVFRGYVSSTNVTFVDDLRPQ